MQLFKIRRTLLAFCAMATSTAALALIAEDSAAAGTTGPYAAPAVECWRHSMLGQVPGMSAVSLPDPPGSFTLGPTHFQWVAHRHLLLRWSRNGWVLSVAGPWWKTHVPDTRGYGTTLGYYVNLSTGARGNGTTSFPITARGHYQVVTQMYWYGDQYVGSGSLRVRALNHTDWRSSFSVIRPYCSY